LSLWQPINGQQVPRLKIVSLYNFGRLNEMALDWGSVPAYFGGIALAFTAATIWRDRKKSEREQAQRVAGWLEKDQQGTTVLRVRNASDLPVFHVFAESTLAQLKGERPQIGPGATEKLGFKPEEVKIEQPPRMTFTDAAGRRWERTEAGKLKRYGRSP
jgi:hypothetical protein